MEKDNILEMIAYEAFIRRASEINLPFMLKGSYVTRQYFSDPAERFPNDLDWVYMNMLEDVEEARSKFDEWLIQVTELYINDGITFTSFKENAFWRMIDYAMADDFPTVNTDLTAWVDHEKIDCLALDISFNLDIESSPIPLLYKPLRGKPFTIPYTVPLSLQVSWKIHQTLVRPRFKDIFDLIYLLQHPAFTEKVLEQTIQALMNECNADNVDINRLSWLLSGNLASLFPKSTIHESWNYWRHDADIKTYNADIVYEKAKYITHADTLPVELAVFTEQLKTALNNAGLNDSLLKNLPKPTRKKRKDYEKPLIQSESTINSVAQTNKSITLMELIRKLFK